MTATPQCRKRQRAETSEYIAMMLRLITALGDRIAADPAGLVHVPALETALRENVNRAVFEANRGASRYSQNDLAAILGVSRQAMQQRIRRGETVYARLATARGAGPLVRLADIRARRAELLAAAAVDDRTGTDRERRAAASNL